MQILVLLLHILPLLLVLLVSHSVHLFFLFLGFLYLLDPLLNQFQLQISLFSPVDLHLGILDLVLLVVVKLVMDIVPRHVHGAQIGDKVGEGRGVTGH